MSTDISSVVTNKTAMTTHPPPSNQNTFIYKKMTTLTKKITALEQANQLLVLMTKAEKAQLLQWIVRDLGDVAPVLKVLPAFAAVNHVLFVHESRFGY